MFERLQEKARRLAEARAERRRRQVAERLAADLPRGIAVGTNGDDVTLSGRALKRRMALDPALRALPGRFS
ncbi:MAG TPA: hypothetical protein VEZ20_12990 [Allosphingosinicella sp.]|nr:hypothetical protein [Allosphingosinicella sp.]